MDTLLTAQPHLRRPHAGAPASSPAEDALDFGFTGPCLRACGVPYDVRKAHPYLVYDRMDFDVPVGNERRQLRPLPHAHGGDEAVRAHRAPGAQGDPARAGHRRRLARLRCRRSRKCTAPSRASSPTSSWSWRASRSRRARSTTTPRRPTASSAGTWSATAAGRPYKVHVRAPGFAMLSALPRMIEDGCWPTSSPPSTRINMIGGEVEQ